MIDVNQPADASAPEVPKACDSRDLNDNWQQDLEQWLAAGKPWIAPSQCSWIEATESFFD